MSGPQSTQRRRTGQGPFRGRTPARVFQTTDFGAGEGEYIIRQAGRPKNEGRKYAVVDTRFAKIYGRKHDDEWMDGKVKVYGGSILERIHEMKKCGEKTRHANMDMPYPQSLKAGSGTRLRFLKILRELRDVLVPNGIFFITTEDVVAYEKMIAIAKRMGYKVRTRRPWKWPIQNPKTSTIHGKALFSRSMIYRIEIINSLKKAIPNKEQRRKWPQE